MAVRFSLNEPRAEEVSGPSIDIVVDGTQFGDDDICDYSRRIAEFRKACTKVNPRFVLLVGLAPIQDDWEGISFVELGNSEFTPTARLSLAMQLDRTPKVIFCSTLAQLSEDDIGKIGEGLETVGLIEGGIETAELSSSHDGRWRGSRTVCFGVNREAYNSIRGFDLRIGTLRDSFEDFRRRFMQWGGLFSKLILDGESVAFESKEIELTSSRHPINVKNPSIFVNFPRWRYRPFDSRPTVTLVRFGEYSLTQPNDLSTAQSMDGVEIIDVDWVGEDSQQLLELVLPLAKGQVLAFSPRNRRVPPWRAEQLIKQLRSADEMCIGAAAILADGKVGIEPAPRSSSISEVPAVVELSRSIVPVGLAEQWVKYGSEFDVSRYRPTGTVTDFLVHSSFGSGVEAAEPGEVMKLAPYLPASSGSVFMVFDQYGAGRVDYINGYGRVVAMVSHEATDGKIRKEYTIMADPSIEDCRTLADLGIRFELYQPQEGLEELVGFLANEIQPKGEFDLSLDFGPFNDWDESRGVASEGKIWLNLIGHPVAQIQLSQQDTIQDSDVSIHSLVAEVFEEKALF